MTGARLTGLVFLLAAATTLADPGFTLEQGEADGAPFLIARPTARWTHRLLLVAQDRRPPMAPLKAALPLDRPLFQHLLSEGWMIAGSAFPRNGTVIAEAVHALLALREHIQASDGSIEQTIVLGEGLGGLDAVLLSEMTPGTISGALAVDPDLQARESGETVGVTLDPKVPLVVLSTQKAALTRALAYITSQMPRPGEDPRPALLVVSRDGLCNVNDAERTSAFKVLEAWLADGSDSLPPVEPTHPFIDVTSAPPAPPKGALLSSDPVSVSSTVLSVDAFDGSFELDARPGDLAAAGFTPRSYVSLRIGTATVHARLLPRGAAERAAEWLVYPDAEGRVRVVPRTDDSPPLGASPGATAILSPAPPTAP